MSKTNGKSRLTIGTISAVGRQLLTEELRLVAGGDPNRTTWRVTHLPSATTPDGGSSVHDNDHESD
jgi:hypothetical protein